MQDVAPPAHAMELKGCFSIWDWSPDGANLLTFRSATANTVELMKLATGERRVVLSHRTGNLFGARFSPDGQRVIMSLQQEANANIYAMDLRTRQTTRLTDDAAIDTSPCYSPDGSHIAFESDRGGSQQIYVMGADGSAPKRITFGEGSYSTPVWSPRGDLIAFTRLSGGTFAIGVMRPDGQGERILSESFSVEGPTFCPNGRVLMFFRESPARDRSGGGYSSRLVSIDITGFNERVINTATDASDPAWSPLLA